MLSCVGKGSWTIGMDISMEYVNVPQVHLHMCLKFVAEIVPIHGNYVNVPPMHLHPCLKFVAEIVPIHGNYVNVHTSVPM